MIEEVDDLAEWLADQAQVWGSCPDSEQSSCHQQRYCRLCWTMEVKRRMRATVREEMRRARERSPHMLTDTAWLAALQDGDNVIIACDGVNAYRRVQAVRLTATQIVIKSREGAKELRFDRETGHLNGRWSRGSPYLLPHTKHAEQAIRTTITAAIVCAMLGKLSRQQIEALAAASMREPLDGAAACAAIARIAVTSSHCFVSPVPADYATMRALFPKTPPYTRSHLMIVARCFAVFLLSLLTTPSGGPRRHSTRSPTWAPYW